MSHIFFEFFASKKLTFLGKQTSLAFICRKPILFNIYINDLLYLFIDTHPTNFADDTTLSACDVVLEDMLHKLEDETLTAILWFDNNFVGTELDPELSFAKVADACGLKGVTVRTMEETTEAIKKSCEDQKKGITTFIEVILNQELGEPFRRDAMKKPVRVAGINKKDMRPQKSLNG